MNTAEKHSFQAEIQQLLNLVIHSLYTNQEIFIRELISNASDASEQLRFKQISGVTVYEPEVPLLITVTANREEGTITITDTGVGMTHDELIENLGTVAHSGTRSFLKQLAEAEHPNAQFVGQFGVGFYSTLMVANKVTVWSRSYQPEESGWKWTTDGTDGYQLEQVPELPRGTRIVLQLKETTKEFANTSTLDRLIRQYSRFVQFPIELDGRRLNVVKAIWAQNKSSTSDDEYNEFYRYIGHEQDDPLCRLHFVAEAPLSVQALLFVPSHNLEAMGLSRIEPEVSLYCRKVQVSSNPKGLLPDWLRFLKGVVESEDLPLNISRDTVQDAILINKLSRILTSRFIKFLQEQADTDPPAYEKFYTIYQRFLKEGAVTDFNHREALEGLLRYESSNLQPGTLTSLGEYVKRMPAEQSDLYCLIAPNRPSAEINPYLEVFKARNFEVLFLYDRWDEFLIQHLDSFQGKSITLVEHAVLRLPESSAQPMSNEQAEELARWFKNTLREQVKDVCLSQRLVTSPAVLVNENTTRMRAPFVPFATRPDALSMTHRLEINPGHPIMSRLASMHLSKPVLAGKVAEQMLVNARIAAGLIDDARTLLHPLNQLLNDLLMQTNEDAVKVSRSN